MNEYEQEMKHLLVYFFQPIDKKTFVKKMNNTIKGRFFNHQNVFLKLFYLK